MRANERAVAAANANSIWLWGISMLYFKHYSFLFNYLHNLSFGVSTCPLRHCAPSEPPRRIRRPSLGGKALGVIELLVRMTIKRCVVMVPMTKLSDHPTELIMLMVTTPDLHTPHMRVDGVRPLPPQVLSPLLSPSYAEVAIRRRIPLPPELHTGHPLGFLLSVRLLILASHAHPHSPHFHGTFERDAGRKSVGLLPACAHSSSMPSRPFSLHHTSRLLVGVGTLPAHAGHPLGYLL